MRLAIAIALSRSAALLTAPESVTTPLNVSTSMRRPPTSGSFRSDVFTRVVMVASSIVSPTLLPHAETNSGASSVRTSRNAVNGLYVFIELPPDSPDRTGASSFGVEESKLHAGGVVAGVHHQHLRGHAAAGRAQQEHRRIRDLG